uniref:Uncharacterized protein n=1 Tax=Triticum urartu TaxID=4572 RepID=A0A8R7R5G3_TRIUA
FSVHGIIGCIFFQCHNTWMDTVEKICEAFCCNLSILPSTCYSSQLIEAITTKVTAACWYSFMMSTSD